MKSQQHLNEDQLRQNLLLEEFKYWDYSRNQVSATELEAIQQKIDSLRSSIFSVDKIFSLFQ